MPTTYLALLALALLGVGGPLLLIGLAGTVSALALVGTGAVWLGVLIAVATVLQVLRIDHQMARSRGERLRKVERSLDRLATKGAAAPPELLERLAALDTTLGASLDAHEREILRVVDARILGLYETLRDADPDAVR